VPGRAIPYVLGDPHLPPEREKVYRRALVEQALRALTTEVTGPTLFRADVA
jgi:glycine reductase